jgi:hypothetical protein
VVSGDGEEHDNDSESEVCLSIDELFAEHEKFCAALISQDKLLKHTARERKEYKDKLEIVLKELEAAKKCAMVCLMRLSAMSVLFTCLALLPCNPSMLLCLIRTMS